jgi:hypothetical protein
MEMALECFSRLNLGQIWAVCEAVRHEGANKEIHYYQLSRTIEAMIKPIMFPDLQPNESYGICADNTPIEAKRAWNIQQVIRQFLSWENMGKHPQFDEREWRGEDSMMGVNFDDPLNTIGEELPTINSWIPVDEHLPKIKLVSGAWEIVEVIVKRSNNVRTCVMGAHFSNFSERPVFFNDESNLEDVTHWMPMPNE